MILHATAVILGDRGLVIQGRSGAGKSTLALALIRRAISAGRFARLIGDDQIELAAVAGRIIAKAPPPICGLVEVYGLSPTPVSHEASGVIDLAVRLVEQADAPRFQENGQMALENCLLPACDLPAGNVEACAAAIHAYFGFEPFVQKA